MKSRFFIFFIAGLISWNAQGQSYQYIYYFNASLGIVNSKDAVVRGKGYWKDDKLVVDCFVIQTGSLLLSATFTDTSLSVLDGHFITYHEGKVPESEGVYLNNDMNGVWRYWNKEGLLTDSSVYDKGIRVANGQYKYTSLQPMQNRTLADLLAGKQATERPRLYWYSFTDSLRDTYFEKKYGFEKDIPSLRYEAHFKGNRGYLITYDSLDVPTGDSVFTRQSVEPEIAGGSEAWRKFLTQNLHPENLDINTPDGKYVVIVRFKVDLEGNLFDIEAENDPGYGSRDEAIRVVKKSPRWQPAILFGKKVIAYRRQPVTFTVETVKQ